MTGSLRRVGIPRRAVGPWAILWASVRLPQEAEGEVDALDLCEPGLGRSCRVPACVCRSVPQTRPTRSRKDAAVTVSDRVPPDLASVHPLDCVVWSSLTGPHAHLAEGSGSALRYPADVSPFATLGPP